MFENNLYNAIFYSLFDILKPLQNISAEAFVLVNVNRIIFNKFNDSPKELKIFMIQEPPFSCIFIKAHVEIQLTL